MGPDNTPTAIQPWTRPQIFVVSRSAEAANNANLEFADLTASGALGTGMS